MNKARGIRDFMKNINSLNRTGSISHNCEPEAAVKCMAVHFSQMHSRPFNYQSVKSSKRTNSQQQQPQMDTHISSMTAHEVDLHCSHKQCNAERGKKDELMLPISTHCFYGISTWGCVFRTCVSGNAYHSLM